MFKLQVQLVLRYAAWLQEVEAAGHGTPAAEKGDNFAGFEAGSMKEWAERADAPALIKLLSEVAAVVRTLRDDVAPAVTAQLATAASEAAMAAVPQVREASETI